MKRYIYINLITLICLVSTSCTTLKTQNTVGEWTNTSVRKDGFGRKIAFTTKLEIIRHGAGDYSYNKTTTEEGNTSRSSGKLDEYINDNKWSFIGGDYGKLEAYIVVPSDKWNDYKPSSLIVGFGSVFLDEKIFVPIK